MRSSISILVLAAAGPPAVAQPTTTPSEEEAELADAIAADQAAVEAVAPAPGTGATATTLLPDISVIADVSLAWFSEDANLQAGGHDPIENGFNLTSVELALGKAVDPYFRFDAQFVFGPEGFELEEAFATTLDLPYDLQARAGQFLTRFGRQNTTHPHAWDFVDQPFALSRVFGGEGNRAPGGELSWLAPTPWYTELVLSLTDARGDESARSFLADREDPIDDPTQLQTTVGLRQFYELSPDVSLAAGASYATAPNASGDATRTHAAGVDVFLKYRPITYGSHTIVALQSEWIYRDRHTGGDHLTDVTGYAYVLWKFARRWATAARYEYGSPARNGDGMTGADELDPDWIESRHRASANLTFWPTEFSRLRLQGSVDVPGWLPDPIWAGFLSFEVLVGAHGAHKF